MSNTKLQNIYHSRESIDMMETDRYGFPALHKQTQWHTWIVDTLSSMDASVVWPTCDSVRFILIIFFFIISVSLGISVFIFGPLAAALRQRMKQLTHND